jgi:hypothetical protein
MVAATSIIRIGKGTERKGKRKGGERKRFRKKISYSGWLVFFLLLNCRNETTIEAYIRGTN